MCEILSKLLKWAIYGFSLTNPKSLADFWTEKVYFPEPHKKAKKWTDQLPEVLRFEGEFIVLNDGGDIVECRSGNRRCLHQRFQQRPIPWKLTNMQKLIVSNRIWKQRTRPVSSNYSTKPRRKVAQMCAISMRIGQSGGIGRIWLHTGSGVSMVANRQDGSGK